MNQKLFLHVQHGLCNRIRALLSGLLLSKISKRKFVLIWEKDYHCDCYFNDLFDRSGFDVYSSTDILNDNNNIFIYNYMENEDNPAKTKKINYNLPTDIYIKTAYVLVHPELKWKEENKIFKKLIIKKDIYRKIVEFKKKFNIKNCLGIHIRSQLPSEQNEYDHPQNWKKDSHEKILHWRSLSSLDRFMALLDKLMKRKSLVIFFVATDEEKNIKILQEKYKERIYFVNRTVFDRSKEQIQYALIDLILLSNCHEIFGSYWSSFSEVAHRLSGKEKISYSGIDF